MQIKEAIEVLQGEKLYAALSNVEQDTKDKLSEAIDLAVVCMVRIDETIGMLSNMDKLEKAHTGQFRRAESECGMRVRKFVTGDESCADCLCRVCARNVANDASNSKIEGSYADCIACECCEIGDELVELAEDCPKAEFLPDES